MMGSYPATIDPDVTSPAAGGPDMMATWSLHGCPVSFAVPFATDPSVSFTIHMVPRWVTVLDKPDTRSVTMLAGRLRLHRRYCRQNQWQRHQQESDKSAFHISSPFFKDWEKPDAGSSDHVIIKNRAVHLALLFSGTSISGGGMPTR